MKKAASAKIHHSSRKNSTLRRGAEIGAAGAVVGIAALASKLVWARRVASKRAAERAFRLYANETVPDGIRRIARGQLDRAHSQLAQSPKRKLAGAVHDTRKSLKRLRATARLVRGGIGDEAYHRENAVFRDTGRRLSGVRDASVLIETLDELRKLSRDDLPDKATAKLRERLLSERKQALESLRADNAVVAAAVADIEEARTRTAAWMFETEGFEALEPGLRRIYRRGRQAMRRAQADPTNENLHEWRKRVKDLWHAEEILTPAAPNRMKKLARRTHALSDLLGDDHDLAELRHYVSRHGETIDGRVALLAQIAVIDRRRHELQRQAFILGHEVYRRSPKRFVKAIERGWRKRAGRPGPAT